MQLLEIYRFIVLTRRLEEMLVALFRQNRLASGVYRSLGQEGTAVGCAYAMRNGDLVQPLIRDLGAVLVHGVRPIAIFRQYMAKVTGPTAGRDLNVHFSAPSHGIVGPISMLGSALPMVAGCLLAARLRGESRAGLAFIGDGGSSTGAFYEAVNFAAVQVLPLITVIEANQYAYSTPTHQQLPHGDLVTRARGFAVPVAEVDGNDALACYQATADARQRGLEGEGPTLIVAHTYRRRGHAEHDGQGYLADATTPRLWAEHNDPLERLRNHLQNHGHVPGEALRAVDDDVDITLATARDQALAEPSPTPENHARGVFADDIEGVFPSIETWFTGGPPGREAQETALKMAPHPTVNTSGSSPDA